MGAAPTAASGCVCASQCVLATQMLERNGSVLLSAATAHPLPPPLGDAMADGAVMAPMHLLWLPEQSA